MNPGNVTYRLVLLLTLTLGAFLYLVPSFFDVSGVWPSFLPNHPIHLGLDLRGGTHLLFQVEVDQGIENALGRVGEDVRREAKDAKIDVTGIDQAGPLLTIHLGSPEARSALDEIIRSRFPGLAIQSNPDGAPPSDVTLAFTPKEKEQLRQLFLDQSLETIRNRIDQFGVSEPSIQRQGDTEILVQLPGVQDPQRAKELIGKTAVLEFHIEVDKAGPSTVSYPGAASARSGGGNRTYILDKKILMAGDAVADARVRPGTQLEGPYVELILTDRGGRTFEQITGENVGKNLAIVLDKKVFSAPVIREKIAGGRASITGQFDIKDARDLAIVLRAGALPAPVKIIEERTVGPSLGQDSIRQGVLSFALGGLLVVAFMLVYYRGAGVVADGALVLNVVFLLALLAAFGATLTLPGIAGIVLTLGMAVDANVLINERIREELRAGKSPRAALEAGYERALPAILDSNFTTFVSGLILFQFGSGPVKGFAVTLCIGIATSIFTAVFGTRIYYDWRLARRNLTSISV